MNRQLLVFLGDRQIGIFSQDDSDRQSFEYERAWLDNTEAHPLSISLPLRSEPFGDRQTRPFFSGLLPDDELRRLLGRYLGVSGDNEFALLAEVGRECAGAISIRPAEAEQRELETDDGSGSELLRILDDKELLAILDELPTRPLYVGEEIRLSLAGAQDKLAVRIVDDQVALPLHGTPSTHILKTPISGFEATVENEFFCMRLAESIGLSVAGVQRRQVGDRTVLIVERYDRTISSSTPPTTVQRIHQEDSCQAMGIPPSLKYQSEGGPSLPQLFALLTEHVLQPAVDRLSLLRWVMFNFLVGNADAHGKNVSLLHRPEGISLAPFYDLMNTMIYPTLPMRMAMRIGSKYHFTDVQRSHWESMARESGLAPAQVVRSLLELAQELPELADKTATNAELIGNDLVGHICAQTETRCKVIVGRLD